MSREVKSSEISLVINGNEVWVNPQNHSSLLAFLRSELTLNGTKQGCATGNCGACSVLIDGVAMQACQVSLRSIENSTVETIENIALTPVGKQITNEMTRCDAAQCGYCLPGIVVAAYAEVLNATEPDPVHALQHNLCRCGTHSRILNALHNIMSPTVRGDKA